jgi:hypothetical protein
MSVVDIVATELETQGFVPMDAFASAVGVLDMLAEKGFAVVPVEPTEKMIAALQSYAQCAGYVEEGYRAMIAAAKETGDEG